ncbi:ABC transporter substrate-binding protein [Nitriliruptor alkaliphilus]|uniref:ABC transporter substrate-binding protein n=1 Tax=Nitriliruptor alkaliphilus TaxID=427918 RepID=UPI000696767B|nr:extracellular solute-binding protein [Nitriliruptor alkaliphilus]
MRGRAHLRTGTVATVSAALLALTACTPGQPADPAAGEGPEPGSQAIDWEGFDGDTLDYVYFTDGPDEAVTRDLIAQFEEETGATVNLQIIPFSELEQSLQARINSGSPPAVARVAVWYPYADSLVDVRSYLGEEYPGEFIEGPAAAGTDPGGRFLGVPNDLTMNGPFINVDAFEAAGVPLPSTDEPWTWDEMVADATAVQQANGMESAIAIDKSGHRLSTVFSGYGTTLLDEDGEALDAEAASAALTQLDDLTQSGALLRDFWLEAGSRYAGANDQFLAQQVPVYLSGNWQVGQFAENATFRWAAVPNACAERCGGFPGGKFLIAFSGSDNPELGVAFVDWMNRAEQQVAMAEGAYWLPTRKDLTEAQIDYPDRAEDMDVFRADVERTPEDTYAAAAAPAFGAAGTVVVEEVSRLFAGQQDVATTVEAIKTGVADVVQQVG